MSKINEQIKELQTKLKKVEFLNHILDSAKKYENKDFKDVKEDVVSSLDEFVTKEIECIENGAAKTEVLTQGQLSQDELNVVKSMVQRVQTKKPVNPGNPPPVNDPYGNKKEIVGSPDKLSFALENRHLANKRVTVANNEGMTVMGEVVGLDAPNVVVKTDTGPTIQVPIGNVSLT